MISRQPLSPSVLPRFRVFRPRYLGRRTWRNWAWAVGKPSDWVREVVEGATGGLELFWRMPIYPEYWRAMDSKVADLKNTGGRTASALTATAFLVEFVDTAQWCHVDFASTSFADEGSAFQPKGGTGFGVGTIVSLVRQLQKG
jgi:leucyl aminopeptidase